MVSSLYSDYSDDESLDVHVRHVSAGPAIRRPMRQPQYVQTVRERDMIREREPRSMHRAGPIMLQPERTTLIHTRSRSREPPCSPPRQPPVVINNNNRIVNEQSDSDDCSDVSRRHHRRRSHSRVRSHSRNSSTHSHVGDLRDKWELEKARLELEELRVTNARKTHEERMDQKLREEAELQRAKRDLDEIKQRQEKERTEKRIRKEVELQKLEEERRETEEKHRREREAKEAVERYKLKEKEREEAERLKKEAFDKEYQRRLREDLLRSGLDDKAIEAVLKREKIKKEEEKKKHAAEHTGPRPTYTRMSLRHLAVETLMEHEVEFEYDQEQPGCVIIKRWVPEWEQNVLWEHTRRIRFVEKKQEKVVLAIDGKKHHHHRKDDETFEWVRKKERHRSKSPGLLMYLAGGRPT